MNNYELLSRVLYDMANKEIGWVGNLSDQRFNEMGEEYDQFAVYFTDWEDAIWKWSEWIKGYKGFAKYRFKGGHKVSDFQEPLKIYWRVRPEISESDGLKRIYARLLISNNTSKFERITMNTDFIALQ